MHSHSRPATCPKRCSCSRDAFHLPLTACALQEDCSYGALANILVCELHAGCIRDALAVRMRFRCTFSGICLSTRHRAHPQTFSHVPHMSCLRCKCPAVPNRISTSEGSDCFLVPRLPSQSHVRQTVSSMRRPHCPCQAGGGRGACRKKATRGGLSFGPSSFGKRPKLDDL